MASVLSQASRGEWTWPNGRAGLLLLLQAHECAFAVESDSWDFAVEISELREQGMCENELRWLLKKNFAEHRIEATLIGDETRCFLPQGGMKFTPNSCFILTLSGECYVRTLLHPGSGGTGISHSSNDHASGHEAPGLPVNEHRNDRTDVSVASHHLRQSTAASASSPHLPLSAVTAETKSLALSKDQRPTWDEERKELWFGPHLIKRFRFQSPNQETILTVFHEEGWPAKIDDPLPPVPNQTSRQRLHDAIKNLNRHRLNRVIRFAGDGTGEGVRWERVDAIN